MPIGAQVFWTLLPSSYEEKQDSFAMMHTGPSSHNRPIEKMEWHLRRQPLSAIKIDIRLEIKT